MTRQIQSVSKGIMWYGFNLKMVHFFSKISIVLNLEYINLKNVTNVILKYNKHVAKLCKKMQNVKKWM